MRVLGLCAALFAVLSWQVADRGPLLQEDLGLDAAVLRAAADHPALTATAQLLADAGNVAVAVPVLAAVLAFTAWRHRRAGRQRWWRPSAVAALVMAAVGPVVVVFKSLLARPAPGTSVLVRHFGYYPSGHASTAAMAAGLAVLVLLPLLSGAAVRRLRRAAVLLNAAVGAGLVWRGYHWPLDVAAAWCLSGALLALAWPLIRGSGSPG